MEGRKFTRDLYVSLTTEERLDFTSRLVELNGKHNQLEDEKKAFVDEINGQKKKVENDMQDVFFKLGRGEKLSEVEVLEYLDEATRQIITKRLDTNSIIGVRRMTEPEKQRDLIFDEEEAEIEFKRDDDGLTKMIVQLDEQFNLFEREITNDEVLSWLPEQYRMVEDWILLFAYAKANSDKNVEVGAMPEILINPVERASDDSILDDDTLEESGAINYEEMLEEGEQTLTRGAFGVTYAVVAVQEAENPIDAENFEINFVDSTVTFFKGDETLVTIACRILYKHDSTFSEFVDAVQAQKYESEPMEDETMFEFEGTFVAVKTVEYSGMKDEVVKMELLEESGEVKFLGKNNFILGFAKFRRLNLEMAIPPLGGDEAAFKFLVNRVEGETIAETYISIAVIAKDVPLEYQRTEFLNEENKIAFFDTEDQEICVLQGRFLEREDREIEQVDQLFEFEIGGETVTVGVGVSKVPEKWKAVTFNRDTLEVTFYSTKKKTNKIAVVDGRIVSPEESAQPEDGSDSESEA